MNRGFKIEASGDLCFLPSPLTGLLNKGRMCIARGSGEELRATIWKISWRKCSASKKLVNEIMISLIGNLQDLYLLPRLRSTSEACYEGGLTWCHYLESPFTLRSVPVWMINYTIPLFEGCGTLKVFTRLSNALRWCCLKIYILGWGIRWWSMRLIGYHGQLQDLSSAIKLRKINIWDGETDPHSEVLSWLYGQCKYGF